MLESTAAQLQQVFFGLCSRCCPERARCDWWRQLFPLLFYKQLPTCERDDRSLNTADVVMVTSSLHTRWTTTESISKHRANPSIFLKKISTKCRWLFSNWKPRYFDNDNISRRVEINLVKEIRQRNQCRLIQWARRARVQGPKASGGPQTADALIFSSRQISVTNY